MDELSEDRLVQLSMDGPSMNVKLLQVVQDDRKCKGLPLLLVHTLFMDLLKRALKKVNGK